MMKPLTKKIILVIAIGGLLVAGFVAISILPTFLFGVGMSRTAEKDKKFFEEYEYLFASTTNEAITTRNPELCTNLIHYKYFFTDMGCDSCFSRYYRNECLEKYRSNYPESSVCQFFSPATETPGFTDQCKDAAPQPMERELPPLSKPVPPIVGEVCDGIDNNGDGKIDEGFDRDGDGIKDCHDNCADVYNPAQDDRNGNGIGDICDTL